MSASGGTKRQGAKADRVGKRGAGQKKARVEPEGLAEEIKIYDELALTRDFKRAWCAPASDAGAGDGELEGGDASSLSILLSATQRSVPQNKQRRTLIPVEVEARGEGREPAARALGGFPVPEDCLLLERSPSGRLVLFARAGGKDDKGCSVLWELCTSDGQVVKQTHVPTSLHGPVYAEGYISRGVAWSADESSVAYVAEVPPRHKTPHWSADVAANADPVEGHGGGGSGKPLGSWTGQGPHDEDFGELFPGKKCAGVFLMKVREGRVAPVSPHVDRSSAEDPYGDLDAVTCGKPVFSPCGQLLALTAWPHVQKLWRDEASGTLAVAKKLGLVYCYNRECHLQIARCEDVWRASEQEREEEEEGGEGGHGGATAMRLRLPNASAHSAIFHPLSGRDGGEYKLFYLSHDSAHESGAHNACAALWSATFTSATEAAAKVAEAAPVIPVVGTPESPRHFQGLFCADLHPGAVLCPPEGAGGLDGGVLFVTSIQRSRTAVLAIDTEKGEVVGESNADAHESWSLIGAGGGALVAAVSGPGKRPSVHLFRMRCVLDPAFTRVHDPKYWAPVFAPPAGDDGASSAQVASSVVETGSFESILLEPAGGSDTLVLVPHGGPHSAHVFAWNLQYEFLLRAGGYSLLLVNYRGSVGFGNDDLLSLPGKVGTQDVADCVAALDAALALRPALKKVAVTGGSHGGFLTLHLLGQHPDRFDCGVVRNPVTSIAGMVSATDIPDWCFVEALGVGVRPRALGPTAADLEGMLRASPIFHVGGVRAPTLWLLGKEDKRVRPLAAMDYIAALRSKNLKVKTIVFPKDSHPLNKAQTEFESFINMIWFLRKTLA